MKTNQIILSAALMGTLLAGTGTRVLGQTAENNVEAKAAIALAPELHIQQMKSMQFRVSFNNPQAHKLSVRILDNQQNILYSESNNNATKYLKYFDLSPLLDGTYTFEITDGKEKHTQSFDIMTQTRRIVSAKN